MKNPSPIVSSPQGAYLTIENKSFLNLASNNYLGLAADPEVCAAAKAAIDKYGVGTASVRALIGTNDLHLELESNLAKFKNCEEAIVVTSGYLANLAAVQTLLDKEDVVISDELNHASIIDAVRLSGVKNKYIFAHSDMIDLEAKINSIKELMETPKSDGSKRKVMIITDGVFSMDGDIAPLPQIVTLAEKYGLMTMVDDAHGEGVLGDHGKGIIDHFHLHGRVDIEVGTLSKAFGVLGGVICGKSEIISLLRTKARQFLFTNALSIPDTAALIKAVELMSNSDDRLKTLWENALFLQSELKKVGFDIGMTTTPITPVMVGEEEKCLQFVARLKEEGNNVAAIKFRKIAKGKARLRLMPSALHTKSDLGKAILSISEVGKELGLIP